jgi:hypothetical protein
MQNKQKHGSRPNCHFCKELFGLGPLHLAGGRHSGPQAEVFEFNFLVVSRSGTEFHCEILKISPLAVRSALSDRAQKVHGTIWKERSANRAIATANRPAHQN